LGGGTERGDQRKTGLTEEDSKKNPNEKPGKGGKRGKKNPGALLFRENNQKNRFPQVTQGRKGRGGELGTSKKTKPFCLSTMMSSKSKAKTKNFLPRTYQSPSKTLKNPLSNFKNVN